MLNNRCFLVHIVGHFGVPRPPIKQGEIKDVKCGEKRLGSSAHFIQEKSLSKTCPI